MNKKLIQQILENSKKIDNYHAQLLQEKITSKDFFAYHDALTLPGGLTHIIKNLRESNQDAIDTAIAFLHVDPDFYHSGYVKEQLLSLLKKVSLSKEHIAALQEILLNKITQKSSREYTDYCKLARVIQDEDFKNKIKQILSTTDNLTHKEKAQLMLDMMSSQEPSKQP